MGLSVALRPRNLRGETLLIRDWNGWWHQALVRNRRAIQAITTYQRPGGRVAIDVWCGMPRHVQLVGVADISAQSPYSFQRRAIKSFVASSNSSSFG